MTTSTPPPAEGFLLKRPNRWPSGRRFRQRHLRAFRIDQRIGSVLLAIAASLLINGVALWQLYTAKPPPLPLPEPEPVIVMLGEPDPDPDALTDLAPLVPAEVGEEAAQGDADAPAVPVQPAPAPVVSTPVPAAPASAAVPEPSPPVAVPPALPPAEVAEAPVETEVAEESIAVTLPEPAVAATAQDLTDLPADTGEVLAADVAHPEPGPQSASGNALAENAAPEPAAARNPEAPSADPVDPPRPPSLPPDAADQLARVLDSPTLDVELAPLPPRAASEPLRALPPQLRRSPEQAPIVEPEVAVAGPELAPSAAEPPAPTLPPATAQAAIERADPARPELVVEPVSPERPIARPVAPPSSRALVRVDLPEPERPDSPEAVPVAPVAPTVAVPEARRAAPEVVPAERPRVALELPVRPLAAPPPVALPPARSEPERVRPAKVPIDLPRERPGLAAPAPAPRPALPPAVEPVTAAETPRSAPALDRDALQLAPRGPTRLDSALLAADDPGGPTAPPAPAAGSDADFDLPGARPGAADGLDWSDSIRQATRDQVAEESAARRAARAPWQRDEAWLADDPPARMQQLLRDDPNLARTMVDFLIGTLANGAAQSPRTIYKVGPDPGVLIQLWLDRHHGDLQLACRRDAGAMSEPMLRVLCPGERTEALKFDAARPVGD